MEDAYDPDECRSDITCVHYSLHHYSASGAS